ncbi:hypothetical protein MRB53_008998 [Persea americana]|uniref:Uncharacterized protein n=1 Tax=Persea americana TaxID=3435 RepID=A0ACC2LNY1_PERAE|nr:hypothetical protein MRB53_008998 [Persea americana]
MSDSSRDFEDISCDLVERFEGEFFFGLEERIFVGVFGSVSLSLTFVFENAWIIEDVRPHGGVEKFRSAAYSNCVRKPS